MSKATSEGWLPEVASAVSAAATSTSQGIAIAISENSKDVAEEWARVATIWQRAAEYIEKQLNLDEDELWEQQIEENYMSRYETEDYNDPRVTFYQVDGDKCYQATVERRALDPLWILYAERRFAAFKQGPCLEALGWELEGTTTESSIILGDITFLIFTRSKEREDVPSPSNELFIQTLPASISIVAMSLISILAGSGVTCAILVAL